MSAPVVTTTVPNPKDDPPKIPQVWGLAFITVYMFFIGLIIMFLFYWKILNDTSRTQQIACPLAKYCKEGDSNNGSLYGISIYFPTNFGDYTDGEVITFPYYDSYSYPTQKSLTITLDTSSDVPVAGTRYQGKTNVGVSGTFPDYTLYIAGYSAREDLSSLMAALFAWTIKSGNTVMSKRSFMRVDSKVPLASGSGVTYLNYSIVVSTISESASDLTSSSSVTGSVILSGSDSVTFSPSQITKSEGYVNVYGDFNFVNKEIVSRGMLDPDTTNSKFNHCVDPGFIGDTCIGLEYDPESGKWYNPDGDPDNPPPIIGSTWSAYADNAEKTGVAWCSFHLSPPVEGEYPDLAPDIGIRYQQNSVSEQIMDNVLKDPNIYEGLVWDYQGNDISGDQRKAGYIQSIVFCGGSSNKEGDSNIENLNTGNLTNTYNARWPNYESKASDYTNIGF